MSERAFGFDVSFYQDSDYTPQKIDFQKMRNNGADFAIMRVGQNTWIDPDWADYKEDSKVDGLLRGSYWFYDARNYVKSQCDLYWYQIQNAGLDLPAVMDWETISVKYVASDRWSPKFFLTLIKDFIDRMDDHVGKASIFYTNPGWLKYFRPLPDWLLAHPIWVAYYGPETYLDNGGLYGYPTWQLWQDTDRADGAYYGVESKQIDRNYFNGTRADLEAWLGIASEPEPDPEPPMTLEEIVAYLKAMHDDTAKHPPLK